MKLRELTDEQLHSKTVETAKRQREITLELLAQLNEVERRHLFSKFSCSSLHGYCVKELKMTSGNACHHMDAARLLREVPAIHEKVLNGTIAITTVADAQAFFKREARDGNKFDAKAKEKLLLQLEDKSTRDADKIMISHSANPEIHLKEKITQKTATIVEVKLHLDEEAMNDLERLREIWSHAMPHAKLSDIIKRAVRDAVQSNDPLKVHSKGQSKKTSDPRSESLEAPSVLCNDIQTPAPGCSKAEIHRFIWKRDQARCTFVDSRTGERCGSKHFVEEDHVIPKAMGGEYAHENIRLRCRAHNQRHAIDSYGAEKMRDHISTMRH